MMPPEPLHPTPNQVKSFRRGSAKTWLLGVVGLLLAIAGQQLPDRFWAAMSAVGTGALMAALIGGGLAWGPAGAYHDDRATGVSRTTSALGDVRRAGGWGLAAAGVGALLASALPPRLAETTTSDPAGLPPAGFVAIVFGGVGIAYGLLEEWWQRVQRPDGGEPL